MDIIDDINRPPNIIYKTQAVWIIKVKHEVEKGMSSKIEFQEEGSD